MQTITINALPARLIEISAHATDLMPVMKAGRLMGEAEVKQRFQSSMGSDGIPWPALKFPRASGGNAKPLLDKGLLQASITGRESADSITIGTAMPQAPLMHFGDTVKPTGGRRFLAIPLTTAAVRSGGPRRFSGALHGRYAQSGNAGVLLDDAGVEQFLLVKQVVVPPRPFMGFSDKWCEKFRRAIADHVVNGRH